MVHDEDRKSVEKDAEDDVEGVSNKDRAPHPAITRSDAGVRALAVREVRFLMVGTVSGQQYSNEGFVESR